jgi:hypothetical protein
MIYNTYTEAAIKADPLSLCELGIISERTCILPFDGMLIWRCLTSSKLAFTLIKQSMTLC